MMRCPKCNCRYEKDVTVCGHCGADLVDRFPNETSGSPSDKPGISTIQIPRRNKIIFWSLPALIGLLVLFLPILLVRLTSQIDGDENAIYPVQSPEEVIAEPELAPREPTFRETLSPIERFVWDINNRFDYWYRVAEATGELTANLDGNTVTISGNISNAREMLTLNIPPGATVYWEATFSGTLGSSIIHINNYQGGMSEFILAQGSSIENQGSGGAIFIERGINFTADGTVIVSGGAAISNSSTARNNITVQNSVVKSDSIAIRADRVAVFIYDSIIESSGHAVISIGEWGEFVRVHLHGGALRGGANTAALDLRGTSSHGSITARISEDTEISGTIPYGRVDVQGDAALIVPENTTLIFGEETNIHITAVAHTAVEDVTVENSASLINRGRVDIPNTMRNTGTIHNEGEINITGGTIYNHGLIINDGTINNIGGLLNNIRGSFEGAPIVGDPIFDTVPEEIRDMLENIPYVGMHLFLFGAHEQPIMATETAAELAAFIHSMNNWTLSLPLESFTSPENANPQDIFRRAFVATRAVQWVNSEVTYSYQPELSVLASIMGVAHLHHITLHHHMEETARQLFGTELEIPPDAAPQWFQVYDFGGVYAYDAWFGGSATDRVPIILSYEYIGGGYEVVCVFLWHFWDEELLYFVDPARIEEDGMTESEMLEYIHTTPDRHTITLLTNPNGGFFYHAHILPEN